MNEKQIVLFSFCLYPWVKHCFSAIIKEKLDNKSIIHCSGETYKLFHNIIRGETFTKCSVLASTKSNFSSKNEDFDVHLKLMGWKEEVIKEVIHKQFYHSPNKVLALKLKLSSNEPFQNLLRCPLLTQLGNKNYY